MDIESASRAFCDQAVYMRGYSPDTVRRYRTSIKIFRNAMGITELEQCTEERVTEFFWRGRAQRGWAASTFATYHSSLDMFFRWCVRQGHLPANPIDGIELPKAAKALPRGLNKEAALRLLEVIHNYPYKSEFERERNYTVFALLVYAGLRKKELRQLQVVDVDVAHLSIFVRRGKGAKDRVVPMSPALAPILEGYLEERRREGKTCPEVFTSLHRDRGLTNDSMKSLVAFANRVTGIRFTAHRLRHTFATLMLEGGCDIFSLSKMMGHSDIKTTTIYLAASAEHLRAQIGKHPLN